MEREKENDADLLYGVPAIAGHLGMTDPQVYHLHAGGKLPTFKIGAKVCARKSSLRAWAAEQEAKALARALEAGGPSND